jgi:hypothetical protein
MDLYSSPVYRHSRFITNTITFPINIWITEHLEVMLNEMVEMNRGAEKMPSSGM